MEGEKHAKAIPTFSRGISAGAHFPRGRGHTVATFWASVLIPGEGQSLCRPPLPHLLHHRENMVGNAKNSAQTGKCCVNLMGWVCSELVRTGKVDKRNGQVSGGPRL